MSVKKSLSFNHNRKKATTSATVKKFPSFSNVTILMDKSSSERATKKNKKKSKALSMDMTAMDKEANSKAIENERRRSPTVKCLSFSREIKIEPAGAGSLKEVDSNKLKAEIIRWAKAVAGYARQISGRFGG